MHLRLITGLIALFLVISYAGFITSNAHGAEKNDMSALYHTITSQPIWLNTERPLNADDLKGRIILLDFWTYCCINCLHVIPELQKLEERFGDDLAVIGIHSAKFKNEKDTGNIRQAILRHGIEHPVVNDHDFNIWKRFGVRAWPTLVLINPNGHIEEVYSGEGHGDALAETIESLIEEHKSRMNTKPLPLALEKDKEPPSTLSFPTKLAWGKDAKGNTLMFVADTGHHRVIGVSPKDGSIQLTIGNGAQGLNDGTFSAASFDTPQGIAYGNGMLYIADTQNHVIRAADIKKGTVLTIAGTGEQGYRRRADNETALKTPLASPWDLSYLPETDELVIAMAGTHQLWIMDLIKHTVSVLAGNGRESIDDGSYPFNSLSQPSGLAPTGDKIYFVDAETSALREFDDGEITTLIGTGLFDFGYKEGNRTTALMQHAIGVDADDKGVYIADSYNHAIRFYDPKTGLLSNFAGTGKKGADNGKLQSATFFEPNDVLIDGNTLYVADTNNDLVRIIKGGRVENFTIMPTMEMAEITYSEFLPNPYELDAIALVDNGNINLSLPAGWKVNDDAPSYLAIFDSKKELKHLYDTKELSAPIAVHHLKEGKNYTLQGTIYYCRKDNQGACLIHSVNAPLTRSDTGANDVTLPIGQ